MSETSWILIYAASFYRAHRGEMTPQNPGQVGWSHVTSVTNGMGAEMMCLSLPCLAPKILCKILSSYAFSLSLSHIYFLSLFLPSPPSPLLLCLPPHFLILMAEVKNSNMAKPCDEICLDHHTEGNCSGRMPDRVNLPNMRERNVCIL